MMNLLLEYLRRGTMVFPRAIFQSIPNLHPYKHDAMKIPTPLIMLIAALLLFSHQAASLSNKNLKIELLSWKPRAFVYRNFLNDTEINHLKALALPRLERSQVVGDNQEGVTDDVRTSYDCFIDRRYDAIVSEIEERVANWTRIPPIHQEELSILKYETGQEYQAHWDEDDPTTRPEITGGEDNYRVATVLMYLEVPLKGGETVFPEGEWANEETQVAALKAQSFGAPLSECASEGVTFKPGKGDAVLFHSMKPDMKHLDTHSLHASCPVLDGGGTKMTATKWIHAGPFRPNSFPANSGDDDEDDE